MLISNFHHSPLIHNNIRDSVRGVEAIIQQFFRRARADNSGVGVGIWPKFELIQAFMHVLVTCKNEVIDSQMKELECSQDFSHYKSMGIFPDAQGQLTPQSLVRSGRISNSSEMLWMFLLPASMKKIR